MKSLAAGLQAKSVREKITRLFLLLKSVLLHLVVGPKNTWVILYIGYKIQTEEKL